ncbi:hypothetical protein NMY22_g4263 [Coprinellus aureogranulatus]|nr:hypothetical protein NMY22_g4263 [Coprinellus aureogranulatus]
MSNRALYPAPPSTSSPHLRALFLKKLHEAPDVLGSGGSRLLVNGRAHAEFEERVRRFFCEGSRTRSSSTRSGRVGVGNEGNGELGDGKQGGKGEEGKQEEEEREEGAALLFNSGFDANVSFFSCIPQPGDAIVYDEYIHASVHDGMRSSRVPPSLRLSFSHNSTSDLRRVLLELRNAQEGGGDFAQGKRSVFVSVESLYSMDGTLSPLTSFVEVLDEVFPLKNAYLVVDEAHSTGIYGEKGRGRVAELGLENRVLARLHTFGKALGVSGAVIITSPLLKSYLLNYARPLIYTTSQSYASIIAADASFDLLEDGTAEQLRERLFELCRLLVEGLRAGLRERRIPPTLLSLPPHLSSPSSPLSSPFTLIVLPVVRRP